MRFNIVSDPAKIARIQKRLAARDRQLATSCGALVRYQAPALPNAFPQLSRILDSSARRAEFLGIHYHIQSKDRRIEQLLPAAEYYKFVFRAVADRRYALELGLRRLRELERWIQQYYHEIRDPTLRTEQPSQRVVEKVYALQAELGSILVLVRGALDTIATLLHFLYGASSSHFRSFAGFVDYLNKRHATAVDPDPALSGYIEEHLEWFRILREYHDYVTQYGSIDISFCEPQEGVVRTYLQDALEVREVVAPVLAGLDSFCQFMDGHFAARLAGTMRS
jgi:hypothetical protein